MKLSEVGELPLLEIIRKRFRGKTSRLVLGIGDDAAVIRPKNTNMLLTTDMMVEGVHFDLRWTTPYQLGFKLVSVNVSDIYAMGGTPEFLLINFAAGKDTDYGFFEEIFDGIENAIKKYGISLIGGDVSSSDRITLSATVTGYSSKVLRRSGARTGDRIYVTGYLGEAACGLEMMKRIKKKVKIEKGQKAKLPLKWDLALPLIQRHLLPVARNPERFIKKASSMIDISDGLLIDLSRICSESRVGARIFTCKIPLSDELKKTAEYIGLSPLELALSGGEDYELLFTAHEREKVSAYCIGEIINTGMQLVDDKGKRNKVSVKGYQHFTVQR